MAEVCVVPRPIPLAAVSGWLCHISSRRKLDAPTLQGLAFRTAKQHPLQECVRPFCSRWTEAKAGRCMGQFSVEGVSKPVGAASVLRLRAALTGNVSCLTFVRFSYSWLISHSSREHPPGHLWFFPFLHRLPPSFFFFKILVLQSWVTSPYTVPNVLVKKLFLIHPLQMWVTMKSRSWRSPSELSRMPVHMCKHVRKTDKPEEDTNHITACLAGSLHYQITWDSRDHNRDRPTKWRAQEDTVPMVDKRTSARPLPQSLCYINVLPIWGNPESLFYAISHFQAIRSPGWQIAYFTYNHQVTTSLPRGDRCVDYTPYHQGSWSCSVSE